MRRLYWGESGVFDEISTFLNSGHIVLTSTDTVPGFLTMCNNQGLFALDRVKRRSDKPYLLLVSTADDAFTLMTFESDAQRRTISEIARHFWPGPLTLICHANDRVPKCAQSRDGSVGIRVPDHTFLRELLRKTGPLFSTSANVSGTKSPQKIDDIEEHIFDEVAAVVMDTPGKTGDRDSIASTVLDCRGTVVRVLREGVYSLEKIRSIVPVE